MIQVNTPKGTLFFKNKWTELNEKELFWFIQESSKLMNAALSEEDDGFDTKVVIKDLDAYHKMAYAFLTLLCKKKRKLLKMPVVYVEEMVEAGIIDFLFSAPSFNDDDIEEAFQKLVVGQFAFADIFFRQYEKTKDTKYLTLFVGTIIYPFDRDKIDHYTQKAAKFTFKHNSIVLFRFKVYLTTLANRFPLAFGGSSGGNTDWRESMLQMAKDGPFGNYYAIENNVRFLDYAAEMHRVKKEYREMKRNSKKA